MKFPSKEIVERIRKEYPAGTRVQLIQMDDMQAPPIGTKGTVVGVDDAASIMVKWDNVSGLNVVYGEDRCRKIYETLREFLKTHSTEEIHIMSPGGYVDLDEEKINQLLDGKTVKAHSGDKESHVNITAKELLSQVIHNHNVRAGTHWLLTDYPKKNNEN
jgi:hypothetical protein